MCASTMQAQAAKKQLGLAGFAVRSQMDGQERIVFPLQTLAFGRARPGGPGKEAVDGQFGLVPDWVGAGRGGAKYGRHCYNARIETVFEKPSFRRAILERRAVVPVDCFYEFPDREIPLRHRLKVRAKNGEALWLAALWERNAALGLDSVAVLTTGPMELLAPYHSRSPLILDQDQVDAWLDPGQKDPRAIAAAFTVHASGDYELVREAWGKGSPQGELF
jgi:putative SOS response-associated peptidase YedK